MDTPGLGQYFDKLLELDWTNKYASRFGTQPTGTASVLMRYSTWPQGYATWFCECEVTIHHRLPLGPFPVRDKRDEEKIIYPTKPGTYRAFLWKEQAEDAVQLGCSVQVYRGYGWREFTSDTGEFVELVDYLLRTSPDSDVRRVVKSATVAGIGRHGMDDILHILVPPEQAETGDVQVNSPHSATAFDYFIHAMQLSRQPNMVHWNSYTMMQCARDLFWFALPYAEKEWLVATNYDNIFLSTWGDEMQRYRPKSIQDRRTGEVNYILHNKQDKRYWVKAHRTIKEVE